MGFLFRLIDTLCKSVGVQTSLKILKYQLSLAQKMANLSRVFKHRFYAIILVRMMFTFMGLLCCGYAELKSLLLTPL